MFQANWRKLTQENKAAAPKPGPILEIADHFLARIVLARKIIEDEDDDEYDNDFPLPCMMMLSRVGCYTCYIV